MTRPRRAAWVAGVVAALTPAVAAAQPLADGDYVVDVLDLPVLGSPRVVGLAGAMGSVGEGLAGLSSGPGGAAARARHESDWFEWEIALGVLFPSTASATRVFGNVPTPAVTDDFQFYDVGLRLQFGPSAFTVLVRPRAFDVRGDDGTARVTSQTAYVDVGWSFRDGAITAAVGVRAVNLTIERAGEELLGITGAGGEVGVLARPFGRPYRLGATLRSAVGANEVAVAPAADAALAVPRRVTAPWELALSGAYGFGERPFNVRMQTPERPRARRARTRREAIDAARPNAPAAPADPVATPADAATATVDAGAPADAASPSPAATAPVRYPRWGVVTGELVVAGATRDGVGLDGFLAQERRTWGARPTVTFRVAAEGEPWRHRMRLRGGVYVEPARPADATPRPHGTAGFDLRLFDTDVFGLLDDPLGIQVSTSLDVAQRYLALGVGVGVFR